MAAARSKTSKEEIRSLASKARATCDIEKHQDEIFINANATKRDLVEFVQRLAYDDKFRSEIEAEPNAVLAEYNINIPRGSFDAKVILPSKDELQRVLGGSGGPTTGLAPFLAFLAFAAFINK